VSVALLITGPGCAPSDTSEEGGAEAISGAPSGAPCVVEKLAAVDTKGCPDPAVETRLINETAANAGKAQATGYRVVTERNCGGRQQFDLLISSSAGASGSDEKQRPGRASFVELIGRDTDGVYNFYSEEGGKWRVASIRTSW
jgi:hypothetical protein